ncbi:hypothetical protein [Aquimarina algiphila]|uniref:hypothetical protein n=1 Tax=Aquimarina algiphila TaxID=2047982 RepID=UPI0023303815|nr:hypothetical protein [Aquimarina algiphila]
MKTTISCILFLFLIAGVTAQEIKTTNNNDKASVNNDISSSDKDSESDVNVTLEEDVCHAELSKVAFYEALIRQNGFDINLKKNNIIALKNTEDIIANNKERISYSE